MTHLKFLPKAKQRPNREPFFSPENKSTLRQGMAWFGLGMGAFILSLPVADSGVHELGARLESAKSDLAKFYASKSPDCAEFLKDPSTLGMDQSTMIGALTHNHICDSDATIIARDLPGENRSLPDGVRWISSLNIADVNAVNYEVVASTVVTGGIAAGLAGMGALAAFGMYKVNEAVAGAFNDADRRFGYPTGGTTFMQEIQRPTTPSRGSRAVELETITSSSADPSAVQYGRLLAEGDNGISRAGFAGNPYVPLRSAECWLKEYLTSMVASATLDT